MFPNKISQIFLKVGKNYVPICNQALIAEYLIPLLILGAAYREKIWYWMLKCGNKLSKISLCALLIYFVLALRHDLLNDYFSMLLSKKYETFLSLNIIHSLKLLNIVKKSKEPNRRSTKSYIRKYNFLTKFSIFSDSATRLTTLHSWT